MSQHRYLVTLTQDQRDHLTHLIRTGSAPSYQQVVARVLLKLDRSQPEPPPSDGQIADALEISRRSVIRIKERFVAQGLEAVFAPDHTPNPPQQRRGPVARESPLTCPAWRRVPQEQRRSMLW